MASYSFNFEGTWWRLFRNYLASYSFDLEGTWWRLFQQLFGFLFFWLWGYLMKVIPEIIWLPILLTSRVPDEGPLASYSFDLEGTWWRLFQLPILLTLRVPDGGYSSFLFFWPWGYLMKVIPASYSFDLEGTWWRLFQKRVMCTKLDTYGFFLSTYYVLSGIIFHFLHFLKFIILCMLHLFFYVVRYCVII